MIIANVEMIDAKRVGIGNVLIRDGIIVDTDYKGSFKGKMVVEASGLTLLPSFIDMHCHLREPGYEYKEDMKSGMTAALHGGFTHLCAMANTNPIIDSRELVRKNKMKSKSLDLCDLTQISALTKRFQNELVDYKSIMNESNLFSNDGITIEDENVMKKALGLSESLGFTILTHCDPESEIVKRDLDILNEVGGKLHICHVSEESTVAIIRNAKKKGLRVSCEVTPHHLFNRQEEYKVNPPLRGKDHRQALIRGIIDNTIDICATDHAPHSREDKEMGSPGISNIETAFSMYWKVFYENKISLQRLSEMMSYEPARILGLNSGEIAIGKEANLVLIDRSKEYEMKVVDFVSKSKNNPFNGRQIKGEILMTIKRGEVKYDNR